MDKIEYALREVASLHRPSGHEPDELLDCSTPQYWMEDIAATHPSKNDTHIESAPHGASNMSKKGWTALEPACENYL